VIDFAIWVTVAYLLGSLPIGLIVGKVAKRIDVREYGSGKTGMTNILRTVGWQAAVIVLALDMGKAVLAVILARIFSNSTGVEAAAGLAALVGHNWPVYTGFRGGRGTATGWATLWLLSPFAALIATIIGMPALLLTRYVSLGSVLGATSGAIALAVFAIIGMEPFPYLWYGLIAGGIVLIKHWDNILRLIRGEERKIGQKAEVT
jgi:glycerol-3-phosphate acyltransferase PlsY